jgi:predicted ATPase/class 3 adenylate cyclase
MTEIKALLLTDVVGSTQLSEALGDAVMAGVWAAHDRAARDLLPSHGGREIDKTDGMLLMFDTAGQAVAYAHAYHQALTALPVPLRARAGLHVGPVILRHNSADDVARGAKPIEVDGLAKPTAARVMALARAQQTLLTHEARLALGEPAGLQVISHGHWLLKGVAEPVEVFEAAEPGRDCVAPEDGEKARRVVREGDDWRPLVDIPSNLPQPATSFVGRERELREVKAHLGEERLVTLLGMGGLGKTRLSLQVAEDLKPQFPDGVWFIDLSPIRDPALVLDEAAKTLGLREEPGRPLQQTLVAHLKTRRVLLILDNCEHLLQPTADLAYALLRGTTKLRLLTSSREALKVPGELSYPVQPLPLPARDAAAAVLMESTAVRLFVERARLHKPGFELTERDAAGVAELVVRLEGIPLALELAAARVRAMGLADINARLRDRYKLLTGGARALQERQQTLRALVDWSYDLLSPNEQALLQRLAVFVDGFSLDAAEAVCEGEPIEAFDILDLLTSLVEKSLVMLDESRETPRYRMLETIRDYAAEKLQQAGGGAALSTRHCEHFFALAKKARDGIKGPEQAQWVAAVETDLGNVRAAAACALQGGADPFIAVKMAVALQGFWMLRGYATEGRAVVKAALALPAVREADMAHAWALYVGAALAGGQGDHAEAVQMLEQCLDLRRRGGHPLEIAATLSTLALSRLQRGDTAGAAASEREALALFRDQGDAVGEAIGLQHLGLCAMAEGDDATARAELGAALTLARGLGHRELDAECEVHLGALDLAAGAGGMARERFARALATATAAGDRASEALATWWAGRADIAEGRWADAAPRLARALRSFQAFEERAEMLDCLDDHAQLALALGRPADAAALVGAVDALRAQLGQPKPARERAAWADWLGGLAQALAPASLGDAKQNGVPWDAAEAVRQALALSETKPA